MKKPTKEELDAALNVLTRGSINPLTTENICLIENGYLKLGNEVIDALQLKNLSAECKMIAETRFWKICQETIRFEAFRNMSEASTMEGMYPGKWMLHNLNVENGILSNILKLAESAKLPSVSNPKPESNIKK